METFAMILDILLKIELAAVIWLGFLLLGLSLINIVFYFKFRNDEDEALNVKAEGCKAYAWLSLKYVLHCAFLALLIVIGLNLG